ncbi:hypothetical protein JXA12_01740 [Candidatus Woesearchaeota archaeon]|nr:hypothetical protein [Candidatus Woesearchaeota archaeon]
MGKLHKLKKKFEGALEARDVDLALSLVDDYDDVNNVLRELGQEVDNYRHAVANLLRRKEVVNIRDVVAELDRLDRLLGRL